MFFKKKQKSEQVETLDHAPRSVFSTDIFSGRKQSKADVAAKVAAMSIQKDAGAFVSSEGVGMDGMGSFSSVGAFSAYAGVPDSQMMWYGAQGFIGYQMCAIIAQHWLLDKACTMAPRDAVRTSYELSADDGVEVDPEVFSYLKRRSKEMKLDYNLEQFARFNRIFGLRVAMFQVDSDDPEYYSKPFNIDGVKAGSYRGISQIDPYWITPELDQYASSDPSNINFYEPTYWRVSGKKIHKSHLVVVRLNEVPDVLKPSYIFGGISIPQKIYERVYGAERTANEGPMLPMTKRLNTLRMDLSQAVVNIDSIKERLEQWTMLRDNYGTRIIGDTDEVSQFDTSLADLDNVIMTQYQLVAAIANTPATKLIGTQPKGFASTGEYEESSYHEELQSIQTHELTPLMDKHFALLVKSEVVPKFGVDFNVVVSWNELDTPTAKEQAEINLIKAQTDATLSQAGAIDGADSRARLIADDKSGFNGLSLDQEEIPVEEQELMEENPDDQTQTDKACNQGASF